MEGTVSGEEAVPQSVSLCSDSPVSFLSWQEDKLSLTCAGQGLLMLLARLCRRLVYTDNPQSSVLF